MYQTSDIRKGLKIEMDGGPYTVVEFQFVKPGKGNAFTRTKMKHLINGNILERSFRTGEQLNSKPSQRSPRSTAEAHKDADRKGITDGMEKSR